MKKKEVNKMSWYFENGPESDVVISTRIRFARNISGTKFVQKADEQELKKINEMLLIAIITYVIHEEYFFSSWVY